MLYKNTQASIALALAAITANRLTPVFDLDGVLLDASHRQATKPDGTLDLEHYIENAYYQNVMDDKALPMLGLVHALNNLGITYHIATARPFCKGTRDKLRISDVRFHHAIHRGDRDSGDNRKDSVLKVEGLLSKFTREQRESMILFDDNLANLQAVSEIGLRTAYIPWEHY